jgi:flagellar protein FlaG
MNVENSLQVRPQISTAAARVSATAPEQVVQTNVCEAPPPPTIKFDPKELEVHLQEAIARLNDMMKSNNRNLAFSRDEALHTTVITVKNTQTGEVVRQIPNEAALRVAHNLEQLKGLFFNEKT